MDKYKFKITKTYNYYGYPQARRMYVVENNYITIKLDYYGNQGYEMPTVEPHRQTNGYFWNLHAFMKDFYSEHSKIKKACMYLKEDESIDVEIEY